MNEPYEELRACVETLQSQLRQVEERLTKLEQREGVERRIELSAPGRVEEWLTEAEAPPSASEWIPLVGRTLLVLGGAYLLRVITPLDGSAAMSALGGVVAGLLYGVVWVVLAGVSARRGRRLSSTFHGLAGLLISYPLVWETTTRYPILSPLAAAVILAVFLVLALLVSWPQRLRSVAWSTTLATIAMALGLLVATHELLLFSMLLLFVTLTTECLAFRDRLLALRWPVAFGLDIAIVTMLLFAIREEGLPEGYPPLPYAAVIAVSLAVPLLFLTSIAGRCLLRGLRVTVFEALQAAIGLALGLGGSAQVIMFHGGQPFAIGLLSLLLGALCYALAFTFIDRTAHRGRNFYVASTLAILLILLWSPMILGATTVEITWSVLAFVGVWLGGYYDRITLRYHATAYLIAAAAGSNLLGNAFEGLVGPAAGPWQPVGMLALGVAVVSLGCYGILVATRGERSSHWLHLIPRGLIAALAIWVAVGLGARYIVKLFASAPGPDADAALVATIRTCVIATAAIMMAWSSKRWGLQVMRWLVYPALVGGGFRLIVEDMRHGRPETLFFSFAFYGIALITVPRMMKRAAAA